MNHTKEKHDQYYEMAHSPISHIIPKLAAPTIAKLPCVSGVDVWVLRNGNL